VSDEKILLRPLVATDLVRTLRWMNNPAIARRIGVQSPVTKESQDAWFADLAQRRDKNVFAICLHKGGDHIGNVSLDNIDHHHGTARLSIFIAEQNLRGTGHGSEALRLLVKFAFEDLALNKVWCKVTDDEDNLFRFYEKQGFLVEGKLQQHECIDGRFVDKILLGLLRGSRG
jgi:RimJ/RimL family protein N-acetyltransferase